MKYAITFIDKGMENARYVFSAVEAARIWCEQYQYNVGSLDMCIQDESGKHYEAGFDGGYFLNQTP